MAVTVSKTVLMSGQRTACAALGEPVTTRPHLLPGPFWDAKVNWYVWGSIQLGPAT